MDLAPEWTRRPQTCSSAPPVPRPLAGAAAAYMGSRHGSIGMPESWCHQKGRRRSRLAVQRARHLDTKSVATWEKNSPGAGCSW